MMANQEFSMDDLNKIMEYMGSLKPPKPFGMGSLFDPLSVMGIPVITEPPPQKVKLSESVQVTDEFRDDFDTWLAGFFGYHSSIIPKDHVFMSNYGIHVRQDHMAMIRNIATTV
jgi:hypothetical protein